MFGIIVWQIHIQVGGAWRLVPGSYRTREAAEEAVTRASFYRRGEAPSDYKIVPKFT